MDAAEGRQGGRIGRPFFSGQSACHGRAPPVRAESHIFDRANARRATPGSRQETSRQSDAE